LSDLGKWARRFLELARFVAAWSRDPSTKVGAVVADQANRVVSLGYNGFARGVRDNPERYADREMKLKMVVHAERNAILFAAKDLKDCTLYTWPFQPCSVCAAMVIQVGISRVVAPVMTDELRARWGEDVRLAERMFHEAVVALELVEGGDLVP
jgi:dCMP deaminase